MPFKPGNLYTKLTDAFILRDAILKRVMIIWAEIRLMVMVIKLNLNSYGFALQSKCKVLGVVLVLGW